MFIFLRRGGLCLFRVLCLYLFICFCLSTSVFLSFFRSMFVCISLSLCLFGCLLLCLFNCLSIFKYIYQSMWRTFVEEPCTHTHTHKPTQTHKHKYIQREQTWWWRGRGRRVCGWGGGGGGERETWKAWPGFRTPLYTHEQKSSREWSFEANWTFPQGVALIRWSRRDSEHVRKEFWLGECAWEGRFSQYTNEVYCKVIGCVAEWYRWEITWVLYHA